MESRKIIFAFAALAGLTCSCQKMAEPGNEVHKISVAAHLNGSRSAQMTRGTVATSDNLSDIYSQFIMDCWVDGDQKQDDGTVITERHYFDKVAVNYESGSWELADTHYWVSKVPMRFWSYAPVDLDVDNTDLDGEDEIQFHYDSPEDFDSQKDVLFAYNYETWDKGIGSVHTNDYSSGHGDDDDKMDIRFFHALSSVRFALSTDDGTFAGGDHGYEIVNIAVNGAPESGDCTFDGAAANEAASAPFGFSWSNLSGSLSSVYACGNWNTTEWTASSYSSYNLYLTKDVFFFIPNSSAGKSIDVTFKRKDDSKIIVKKVDIDDTWKAGEEYIYKIVAHEVNGSLAVTVAPFDWIYEEEDVNYHTVIAKENGHLEFDSATCIVNTATREVTVQSGKTISASFWLDSPLEGEIHLALSGYIGAFEIDDISSDVIDGNKTTFTIKPLVTDPKQDYTAQIHLYVTFNDGKTVNADDVVQTDGVYTIILPAN